MKRYLVKVKKEFNDYQGKEVNEYNKPIIRKIGDIFKCSKERYLYLKEYDVVYLVGIDCQ